MPGTEQWGRGKETRTPALQEQTFQLGRQRLVKYLIRWVMLNAREKKKAGKRDEVVRGDDI